MAKRSGFRTMYHNPPRPRRDAAAAEADAAANAAASARHKADLIAEPRGSIALVRPVSDAGAAWLRDTAPGDAAWWGAARAVEPEHLDNVLRHARDAGLEVW